VEQQPPFELTVHPDRDRVRVAAAGEIDLVTAPLLAAQLSDLLAAGWTHVIADLSGVTFLDSTGVHVLVIARSNAIERGAAFHVANGNAAVSQVLRICGVEGLLTATPRPVKPAP
jgi:anti-sigma B factor antagonist